MVWEEILFKEFPDGRHLEYRNGMTLAILNIFVALMFPIKFQVNPPYGFGDVV